MLTECSPPRTTVNFSFARCPPTRCCTAATISSGAAPHIDGDIGKYALAVDLGIGLDVIEFEVDRGLNDRLRAPDRRP